jgi:hypothetical protein
VSFISKENVRAVRLKKATDVDLPDLNVKVKIGPLVGEASLLAIDLQKEVNAGTKKTVDLFRFVVRHAVTTPEGDPLSDEDQAILCSAASLTEIGRILEAFNKTESPGKKKTAAGKA